MLKPNAIYIGDNGRLMCCDCAGVTPLYSGRDLSGQRVERLDTSAVFELREATGKPVTCECRRVCLSEIAGQDGWPMRAQGVVY
jgi:hypothetical protein